jgi:hypothetical protein
VDTCRSGGLGVSHILVIVDTFGAHVRNMSGNGARGTRRAAATGRGRNTKRRERKELGKAALRSIVKNDETAEEFLNVLESGGDPGAFQMATVTRALGGGRFMVQAHGEAPTRATLEGLLTGRGSFWKNPEVSTAVRVGGHVVVEDVGLGHMAAGGHHRIVAILDVEQARRARKILGLRSANAEDANMAGYQFNRSGSNGENRIRAMRKTEVAAASVALAALRRGTARATARRSSSGKMAGSAETSVSSEPNWAKLSDEKKANMKAAKLSRRKERRKAKKAAGGGGGSAWSFAGFF